MLDTHNACITWRLGNGTILLQNLVSAEEECTDEKISFWSQFVDLYYKTVGGSVSCCYSDLCNDGSSAVGLYPTKQFNSQLSPSSLASLSPPALGKTENSQPNISHTSRRRGHIPFRGRRECWDGTDPQ